MTKLMNAALAGACIIGPATIADAQPIDQPTDVIIVSATRTPTPISQVGASVSVIDAAALQSRQYQFAGDAIADVAGAAIAQNGAFGGQSALRIRGEASGRTLVRIDGVVVNDPSAPGGGFNFANLDVADIEQIEILKGPQSILYGSEAIGGVVDITTKRGAGRPSVNAFAEAGSFKTYRAGAGVSGGGEDADYRINVFGLRTDGISKADAADGNGEADDFESIAVSGAGGVNLADALRLEGNVRYGAANTEFDGFPPPNFSLADSDDRDETEELYAAGRAIVTLFDGNVENVVSLGYSAIERNNFSGDTLSFFADGERVSAEYLGRFTVNQWLSGVVGAETEETEIDTGTEAEDITVNSVFGLLQLAPIDRLTITGGVRHDDHETFGGATTGRATAALRFDEVGATLRGSWGTGFAAPSLFQLNFVCCGGTAPNRDLEPEKSEGWDVSIEKTAFNETLRGRVTYFRQVTENLIDFDFLSGAYINVDETVRKGVEFEGAWAPSPQFSVDVSYAYIDAIDRSTDLALLRQPRHAVTGHITWRPVDPLQLSTSVRYNGEERDGGGDIPSFFTVDLRGAYAVSDSIELYGRVENLFDEEYQDILGYGEPGLSAFGGVRLRL